MTYPRRMITKTAFTPTGPAYNGSAPGIWRLDEVAYWIKQGVWPNPSIIPDQYFPYVSLLLSTTALSNANNNLFVDSSGAFNPISRTGNTTQGSFTPYGADWSNYFDGSGDYLTAPDNAALQLGSSDFTVEFWVNFSVVPGALQGATLVSKFDTSNTGYEVILYNNTMYFQAQTANIGMTYAFTPTAGTWYHIAWTRSGANSYGFINGALVASTSAASGSITNLAQALQIGRRGDNTFYLTGYMSNVRVVKGTAVYTAAFTPPTAPLTAITNTSLLTCQSNRFRDASTNNFTITVNGNTSVTEFSPFAPAYPGISYNQSDITNWSGYFDGDGDYLSIPNNAAFSYGTGDFTMEAWVYKTATSGDRAVVDSYTIGSGSGTFGFLINNTQINAYQTNVATYTFTYTVPNNSWNHIAFVRTGGNLICYVNGTSIGSQANSANFISSSTVQIGRNAGSGGSQWIGYISNLRIVKGTAVYTANFTPSTTNLTAISGTSLLTLQNAAFTDNSTNNFVITINGNTTVTGNSPFNTVGYWSNYFDGSGDYLTTPTNAAFGLGTGDFTIELWTFTTAYAGGASVLIDFRSGSEPSVRPDLEYGNTGTFNYRVNGSTVISGGTMPLNTWAHIALCRSSGTTRLFLNGTQIGSSYSDSNNYGSTARCQLGADDDGSPNAYFFGYMSNARVVKGTALYTTTFTPPTSPLTAISGTSLLTCQNGQFIDNSTNAFAITVNGNTSTQSFDPFYTATIASNGGSMYFDGTGDYLTVPSSPGLNFGTSNWTIECWVYVSTRTTNYPLLFGNNRGSFTTDALALDASNADSASYNDKFTFAWGSGGFTSPSAGNSNLLVANATNDKNTWYHVALVRESSTSVKMYRNGVQVANATVSSGATFNWGFNGSLFGGGNWNGASGAFNGYISNLRATPSAVYTAAFTPPTTPLTPSANTVLLVNGMNAGAYDATAINNMETVGNAQVSTVQSKFGGSSAYFDGSGDGLKFPSNTPMSMGTGNFTWELWVRATAASGYQSLIDTRTAALTDGFFFGIDTGTLRPAVFTNATVLVSSTSLTANTWQHLALVRSSGTLTIYLNGTSIGSVANSTNLTSGAGVIGASDSIANPNYFNGYIDDMRITRGVARYTANFTPPTQAFPPY